MAKYCSKNFIAPFDLSLLVSFLKYGSSRSYAGLFLNTRMFVFLII